MLNYVIQSLPIVIGLIVWAVRIEIKLAKIQTDITWMMKNAF